MKPLAIAPTKEEVVESQPIQTKIEEKISEKKESLEIKDSTDEGDEAKRLADTSASVAGSEDKLWDFGMSAVEVSINWNLPI